MGEPSAVMHFECRGAGSISVPWRPAWLSVNGDEAMEIKVVSSRIPAAHEVIGINGWME